MNDLELVGTRGFFRPVARVSFEQGAEMIVKAMKQARSLGLADLVVNVIGLTGFEPLKTFERYAMATKWVESAGAALRVAWVLKPELIDPQKIGLVMAQNRGASGEVFATETEALDWLDARRATRDQKTNPSGGVQTPDRT